MIPHVRNSDGGGHGPHQTVPDDFDLEKCEKAGTDDINISERVVSDTDSGKELYICNICGKRSKGYRGFAIHLSKTEDDDEHPADVDHLSPSDTLLFRLTKIGTRPSDFRTGMRRSKSPRAEVRTT